MFCPKCGNKNNDNAKFCGSCGFKFNLNNPVKTKQDKINFKENKVFAQQNKSYSLNQNANSQKINSSSFLKRNKKLLIILSSIAATLVIISIVIFAVIVPNLSHKSLVDNYSSKITEVKNKKSNLEKLIVECEELHKKNSDNKLIDSSLFNRLSKEIEHSKKKNEGIVIDENIPSDNNSLSSEIERLENLLNEQDSWYRDLESAKKEFENGINSKNNGNKDEYNLSWENIDLSSKYKNELSSFIEDLFPLIYNSKTDRANYNCENPMNKILNSDHTSFKNIMFYVMNYLADPAYKRISKYPVEQPTSCMPGARVNPLQKFNSTFDFGSWYISENSINFLLKEIFNCSDTNFAKIKNDYLNDCNMGQYANAYLYNGTFYVANGSGKGTFDCNYSINSINFLQNQNYDVSITISDKYNNANSCTIQGKFILKKINDKFFWTLKSLS